MKDESRNYRVEAKTNSGFESGVSLFKNQKAAFEYAAYLMRQGQSVLITPPPQKRRGA